MANSTERIGVSHCGEIAARKNWLFREQPINDVGIDAHIEFCDDLGNSKQLIGLQLKSGESWFKEIKNNCVIFRKISERQYNYWTTNSLPCIIVLYNPTDNMCIWQKLTIDTIKKTNTGKGFYVEVPMKQVFLDDKSNEILFSFSNLPKHVINYNFLLSQKVFMQIIKGGGIVKLTSVEWVNKSSGRGETNLIVYSDKKEIKYSFPYYFPFTPYENVFPRLFPWATFSIDKSFYDSYDESRWLDLHCYYDKEENELINVGKTLEEFRESLPAIRGVPSASGETCEYRLLLGLNELGDSFLRVNEYVEKEHAYSAARPRATK